MINIHTCTEQIIKLNQWALNQNNQSLTVRFIPIISFHWNTSSNPIVFQHNTCSIVQADILIAYFIIKNNESNMKCLTQYLQIDRCYLSRNQPYYWQRSNSYIYIYIYQQYHEYHDRLGTRIYFLFSFWALEIYMRCAKLTCCKFTSERLAWHGK